MHHYGFLPSSRHQKWLPVKVNNFPLKSSRNCLLVEAMWPSFSWNQGRKFPSRLFQENHPKTRSHKKDSQTISLESYIIIKNHIDLFKLENLLSTSKVAKKKPGCPSGHPRCRHIPLAKGWIKHQSTTPNSFNSKGGFLKHAPGLCVLKIGYCFFGWDHGGN